MQHTHTDAYLDIEFSLAGCELGPVHGQEEVGDVNDQRAQDNGPDLVAEAVLVEKFLTSQKHADKRDDKLESEAWRLGMAGSKIK